VAVAEPGDGPLLPLWSTAHGLPASRLGVLTTLFVDPGQRRTGLGRQLHDVAVAWLREAGRGPCLDVVPLHAAATAMYAGLGWVEVGRGRPAWLPADAPDLVAMVLPA
jgi:GNAT superfamily N-acetyltransferase